MKNVIICDSLYADIAAMNLTVGSMDYEENILGEEIKDFQFIPAGLKEQFQHILSEDVEIQSDSGIFRKPLGMVHYEPFYQHAAWMCVVAIEATTLTLHQHVSGYDIQYALSHPDAITQSQFVDPANWTTTTAVTLQPSDFIFIRPWAWHSLTEHKMVQIFLLNQNLKDKG